MRHGIFGPTNPNHDIFIVPTEEGPDEEDNMSSMIGDATMHHLNSLTSFQRQVWEYFVLTGGENLFSFIPSPADVDQDPYNLKVEDLDKYFENNQVPESMRVHMEEAIEQERERREKSTDAYDRATELIPFQDWEDNPGLFTHYDLPTTPKNLALYAGNTSQLFYDYFPDGHPDSKKLNQYLGMMNRDAEKLTAKYGEFVKTQLDQWQFRDEYAYRILCQLTDYITEGTRDPEEVTCKALCLIDENWRKEYVAQSQQRLQKDAVYQLMKHKAIEWEQMYDEGISVLPAVKAFGQLLFTQFRKEMRKHHWQMYRQLKNKYSFVKLVLKGVDLNTARPHDMSVALGISDQKARAIWHGRPFLSLGELQKKGHLTQDQLVEKGDIEEVYQLIQQKEAEAREKKNLKVFSALSQELISRQKQASDKFSTKEWGLVWNLYRSTKDDILSSLRGTTNG